MVAVSKGSRKVRELRKLLRKGAYRDETNTFVIEGQSLLREAVLTGNAPIDIFIAEDSSHVISGIGELNSEELKIWELEAATLKSVASTQNPQSVLATVPMVELSFDELINSSPDFLVIGFEISDPGNAGTIIRTAAAAGANGVIFSEGSVDIYNPKVVRASAGAIFRIPVIRSINTPDVLRSCEESGIRTLGLSSHGSTSYDALNFNHPLALVVGNETRGLTELAPDSLTAEISIPMEAGVESLNVAAALSVVSYEVWRQRAANDL